MGQIFLPVIKLVWTLTEKGLGDAQFDVMSVTGRIICLLLVVIFFDKWPLDTS